MTPASKLFYIPDSNFETPNTVASSMAENTELYLLSHLVKKRDLLPCPFSESIWSYDTTCKTTRRGR